MVRTDMAAERVNLYDFDETIYDGQSILDFYLYCITKYPRIIRYIPKVLVDFCRINIQVSKLNHSKINYHGVLTDIDDIKGLIEEFWKSHRSKIKPWYLERKQEGDVIITASPRVLVEPICNDLGVHRLIATEVDKSTGAVIGKLCFNGEKTIKFIENFPELEVQDCFTDNPVHDGPLLSLAQGNRYHVKGNRIVKL